MESCQAVAVTQVLNLCVIPFFEIVFFCIDLCLRREVVDKILIRNDFKFGLLQAESI